VFKLLLKTTRRLTKADQDEKSVGGLMKAYALKVALQWRWNFWNAYHFFTPLSNKRWEQIMINI
jgi:hypothetical protein